MKVYKKNARVPTEISYGAILHVVGQWGEDWVTIGLVASLLDISHSQAHKLLSEMVGYGWLCDYKMDAAKSTGKPYCYRFSLSGGYHYKQNEDFCEKCFRRIEVARRAK